MQKPARERALDVWRCASCFVVSEDERKKDYIPGLVEVETE